MRVVFAIFSVFGVAALFSCHGGGENAALALAPVAALPSPRLPSWISSISPTKQARTLAQIRIIFNKPITSVGALEGNGPAGVLSHLRIDPALPGNFVVYTPRMIGFVPEQALPVGTRVRVTLTAGLRDLAGDALAHDLAWTFQTQPLEFRDLPSLGQNEYGETPAPSGLRQMLRVTANAQVDLRSLAARASLEGGGAPVALDVKLETQPTPPPGSGATEAFDPSLDAWTYDLTPRVTLQKATAYRLVIAPGVAPANGNLPTLRAFTGAIRTYGPLSVTGIPTPAPGSYGGRFARGDPVIAFNNPLDPKSIAGNVTISPEPQPAASPAAVLPGSPNVVAIDPYLLSPRTTYSITIGTGITDVFGQQLGSPQTLTIHTGDFTPGLWAPSGTKVFPSVSDVALNIYATNLPGDAYRADYLRLTPAMLVVNGDDPSSLLPNQAQWPARVIAGARPNVQSVVRVPLRRLIGGSGGALAYGIALSPNEYSLSYTGIVSLTNLGVFVQTMPSRATIRVARLSDGAPVAGASIALYRTGNAPSTSPCASGTTGALGALEITGDALQACYGGGATYAGEAPPVMAVASFAGDWSYARVNAWSGTENMGDLDTTWQSGAPLSRGTIFTDRQMYQPGENGRITGVAYAVRNGVLTADRNMAYVVTLTNPSGATRTLATVRTDAFGVFSLPVLFGANQPLGYYGIAAKGEGNEIDGGLRVAEFKPPNFKLDLSLDRSSALAGATVTANARASYLFGAPLSNAAARINVTRQPATLAPQGWDDYTFGRQWFWPEEQPEIDTDVLSTTGTFDRNGTLAQAVSVARDLPFPMTYSVDVQATDVSHLSVDTTQSFTALASGDGIIGLKTDLVGQAGRPLAVQVIATDLNGKPIAGRSIHLDLQSMTYTSATQLVEGGENAQNGVEYATVDSAGVTSGDAPVTVTLHPKDAGPYRIRANFQGAPAGSETDLQAFVIGPGEVNWGTQNNATVSVKLDKKQYRVGETARALIASPFARSDIYFAVVRDDVLLSRLVRARGNGPTIAFRVTPAMLPNAAVEAFVVRRGPSIGTPQSGTLDSLARIGFAPLHVDLSSRYLKVAIAPQRARLEPGAEQRIALRIRTAAGRPASGAEAIVIVADDAILQLTGYRPPDLVQTIFADQPIPVRYADNRGDVVLRSLAVPAEKGWGYGGGYLAGAGSTRVRRQFRPLAYYGIVRLDAGGRGQVSFKLPDELTTWRAMVVAVSSDDRHFGNADAAFIATKTLLTNPLLPQFARPGDTIDAGISALDVAGGGTLRLHGWLTGALSFASGSARSIDQTQTLGGAIAAFRFPMSVGTPAPTSVVFSSTVGSASDAFSVPFTVRDRSVTESVVDAGATGANAVVPVDFTSGGTVRVTLANSVVPQFALPAGNAMAADPQPFLDDAASRLVIASATISLAPRYHLHPSFNASKARSDALAAIVSLQQSDGGFAFFKGTPSDPFESGYAVEALAFAQARGASLDPHVLENAKTYLERTLLDPTRYAWCKSALCLARMRLQMLLALAALGEPRNDFLSDIVAQAQNLDVATQIDLARYLLRTPGWRAQGTALADSLEQNVYRTGRYANLSANDPWGWLGTPVDGQAAMLRLLRARGASASEIDGAVRALVAQQCRCGWGTLAGTAAAVEALAEYASREHLSPFHATVTAGGKTLARVRFGTTASSKTIVLPASSINAHALTFTASGGTLHYALLYTYPVPSNAAGVLAGLRVIRTVRAVNDPTAIATMDLAPLSSAVSLSAGDVVDVGVQVIADHPVDRLVIDDPLPAGLEAVDEALRTSSTAVLAQPDSWQIENQQIYADRVTAYADHLEPGIYEMHYLARAVTPGTYRWPGARAYLRDAPEEFGRSAFATLEVH